jgi:hypothetical protein
MRTATKSKPRFRVGDWVSYRSITHRKLAQIIEDRGLLGLRGRRLYDVRLDRCEPYPETTTVVEEDMEKAPADFLPAEEAKQQGFSTDNWPCQEFDIRYTRKGKTNTWSATLEVGRVIEGRHGASGVIASSPSSWESKSPGSERFGTVTVLVEFDPRPRDPRANPVIWPAMVEEAQRLADRSFKYQHPKAVIERD